MSPETVYAFLTRLFPDGTRPEQSPGCDKAPSLPTDVFAAAASLVERCEVYRHVMAFEGVASAAGAPGELVVSPSERQTWMDLGARWRESPKDAAADIQAYWDRLMNAGTARVDGVQGEACPAWWRDALALLVIADEASLGLGFAAPTLHWSELLLRDASYREEAFEDAAAGHIVQTKAPDSFCFRASPYVARVVPKSRAPRVGCTMRTLSHNLALLAPRSSAAVSWLRKASSAQDGGKALNILVVPFPYTIEARCFSGRPVDVAGVDESWGFFDIEQRWLLADGVESADSRAQQRERIVTFILDLVARAQEDVARVDAIVLPEGALDWPCYRKLVEALRERQTTSPLEFIISGASGFRDDPNNFVLTTTFSQTEDGWVAVTNGQAKHHRWRLDERQIRTYALGSALDPSRSWWEQIAVDARRIGLTVFRRHSSFAAMICEDLARSEPCHAAIRAAGPNLVFALLMDGPQLPQRWAAQYATVLADDPGSSVLTLTSLGLIERSNMSRQGQASRTVALWKDGDVGTVPLDLPAGRHAILLTLTSASASEITLDGRKNDDAVSWRYSGHQYVTSRNGI
ncbi:hypothetical protein [Salinarimonas sp.]|uniref:hypothetical protein n=1 Tax=Salinarimonas sp. TaxID=2766526 RepID=UPI0032D8D5EF